MSRPGPPSKSALARDYRSDDRQRIISIAQTGEEMIGCRVLDGHGVVTTSRIHGQVMSACRIDSRLITVPAHKTAHSACRHSQTTKSWRSVAATDIAIIRVARPMRLKIAASRNLSRFDIAQAQPDQQVPAAGEQVVAEPAVEECGDADAVRP
jgi:hypothetical protein